MKIIIYKTFIWKEFIWLIIMMEIILMKENNMITSQNPENIFIYHYVEEMVSNYGEFLKQRIKDEEISMKELPLLIRIFFSEVVTQKELVNIFNISEGQIAKILKKFEDKGYIIRYEKEDNHRIKIVELTTSGQNLANKYISYIEEWENNVTSNMTLDEKTELKKLLYKIII